MCTGKLICNVIGHNWELEEMDKQVVIPDKHICYRCCRYTYVKTITKQEWELDEVTDFKTIKTFIFKIKLFLFKNPLLSRWTKGYK